MQNENSFKIRLFTIPNLITSLNLIAGCIAVFAAFSYEWLYIAPYFIFIAAIFDFMDGFIARALKSYSEIGKELDSLADMVSFGVAPGVIAIQILRLHLFGDPFAYPVDKTDWVTLAVPLIIPVCAALRLAKFNIDDRQHLSFIGLPTPASAFLIAGTALIIFGLPEPFSQIYSSPWVINVLALIVSALNVSEIPMFSLKFVSFKWNENKVRYAFLIVALLGIVFLHFMAIAPVIVLYIVVSVILSRFAPAETAKKD